MKNAKICTICSSFITMHDQKTLKDHRKKALKITRQLKKIKKR